jgi:hypothetical protein
MKNPENYLNHQLNTSSTKSAFLFPKEKRFSYRKKPYFIFYSVFLNLTTISHPLETENHVLSAMDKKPAFLLKLHPLLQEHINQNLILINKN